MFDCCSRIVMKKSLIITGIIAAMCLVGCSKKQTPENVETAVSENQTAENSDNANVPAPKAAPKECVVSSDAAIEMAAWSDANNNFGLNMLRNMQEGSAVVSPFSAQRALGMVYEGACGTTISEMRKALGLPDAKNLSEMGKDVEKAMAESASDENVTVTIDNRIWVEKTSNLLPDYMERVSAAYDVKPRQLDFIGDTENARKTINADVAESTQGKIQDILPPGILSSLTRVVLTNAIYFKAPWFDSFSESATQKADFKTHDGVIQVDMMQHNKKHRVYLDNEAFIAVDLSFIGGYSLFVILPKVADGVDVDEALNKVTATLTAEEIRKMREAMSSRMVKLKMPKFRIETSLSLRQMLNSLGMTTAFTHDADFSRMSDSDELMISEVLQKAYIDVNEKGAEAAAATAVVMRTKAMLPPPSNPIEIVVDHPFLFFLMETDTNTALFMGRVNKI